MADRARFNELKAELLATTLNDALDPQVRRHLVRAAQEAAALAVATQFPLLVFPALFEEKSRTSAPTQASIRCEEVVVSA